MLFLLPAVALASPLPTSDLLAKEFNAAKGKVRIVMLVSPT